MECVKEKAGEEQIRDEDGQGALNECGNRSAAHACCPAFHTEPLITTDRRDDESENNGFDNAYEQIAESQRFDGACPELCSTNVQCNICDQETAEKSRTIPYCDEQRQH